MHVDVERSRLSRLEDWAPPGGRADCQRTDCWLVKFWRQNCLHDYPRWRLKTKTMNRRWMKLAALKSSKQTISATRMPFPSLFQTSHARYVCKYSSSPLLCHANTSCVDRASRKMSKKRISFALFVEWGYQVGREKTPEKERWLIQSDGNKSKSFFLKGAGKDYGEKTMKTSSVSKLYFIESLPYFHNLTRESRLLS